MLRDPSLLQKSRHVTRKFARQYKNKSMICRSFVDIGQLDLISLCLPSTVSLYLSLFVSGKQCSTDSEGICCKHQYGYHLMEQCPRSHRIQTGLGTHPRWFQIFHTWHHTVYLVKRPIPSNSKSKKYLLYCMCVFLLIFPSHFILMTDFHCQEHLKCHRFYNGHPPHQSARRMWHVARGLFVMQALQEKNRRTLFPELMLCNAFRVCWSRPSQAVGSKRQHHRVPSEECSPRYRVCPHSLCAVWICGGAWYHSYLQNMWAPVFSFSPTHQKYRWGSGVIKYVSTICWLYVPKFFFILTVWQDTLTQQLICTHSPHQIKSTNNNTYKHKLTSCWFLPVFYLP